MSDRLVLAGLTVRSDGRDLVSGVDLVARAGRITALVGPSGSGKSLTARAAMGIVDIVPGLIAGSLRFPEVSGDDWFQAVPGSGASGHAALARRTASLRGGYVTYAPQSAASALNPGRTVGDQLARCVRRRREPAIDVGGAISAVLDEVGLPSRAARALPGELSGGQAQRAALAVALAPMPAVLIADEPETGLDPVLRRLVTEAMLGVAQKRGVALVLISHDHDTVRRLAHDVVRLGAA
jgi:ABC-type glutathione transport system ATPase component